MEDVYEVDRIIGRRISIARKVEYLVYWKGYDLNECSWVGDSDLECPEAVEEFERRCFEQRKRRRSTQEAAIDRYENEGLATLIDVATDIFTEELSPFYDEVSDFAFVTGKDSAPTTPQLSAGEKQARPLQVATHGWNRLQREPWFRGHIARIRGTIGDTAGHVFYLTEWDDGRATWEGPATFSRSLGVLADYENAHYQRERKKLVRLYQRSKSRADPSLVLTRAPKYMLEKTPAHDRTRAGAAQEHVQSPSRAKAALFDLGTSVLLGEPSPPTTAALAQEEARAQKYVRRGLSPGGSSDSSGVSDIALAELCAAGAARKRQSMADVYIDHVAGSVLKRRRRRQRRAEAEAEAHSDEEEMLVSGTVGAPREQAADSRCGVCMVDVSSAVGGATAHCACSACGLAYHDLCYQKLAQRMELGAAYMATLTKHADAFVCWFCREYAVRAVDEYITWRVAGSAPLGGSAVLLGQADVIVKWKNTSYRHLSWVPFVWLSTTRRSPTLRSMKIQIQAGAPAPLLAERVDPEYTRPAYIIGAKAAEPRSIARRRQQLRAGATRVDEDAWALYTSYDAVWVAWRGLDVSSATWEAPPSPLDDADDYMEWHAAFCAWRRAEMVSVAERRVRRAQATEYAAQPAFVAGGALKPYQLQGAQWLLRRWLQGRSAVLADEMGMGKTIQTIAFLLMAYYSTVDPGLRGADVAASNSGTFPFLVVVPTTLVANWAREFRAWGPALVVAQLSGRAASRDVQLEHTLFRRVRGRRDLKCHVVLTSYEALAAPAGCAAMAGVAWQAVVVDEGHRLKNDRTKTFQTLQRFRARMRLVLTGTPLQNHLRELHAVMSYVDPAAFRAGDDAAFSAATPADVERTKAAVRPYILRRTKAELPTLVPPRYELILPVSMTGLQRELYRATLTRNVALLRDIAAALHANEARSEEAAPDAPGRLRSQGAATQARPKRVSSLNNILMEVRRIVSHPYCLPAVEPEFPSDAEKHQRLIDACGKLKLLHVLLPELRARGHRVLLFAQFKDTLSILEDYLAGEGVGCERIDGDTPAFLRQARVTAFNAPGSRASVFLSSTRTGGLGLNLTSADVVIIYDCDFNPHADLQAMARAHRIGQTKPVYVFKLVTQDSAEERIVEVATRKLVLDHLVIQNMDQGPADADAQQPGQIEQALRHGASLLFGAAADARAEERAIVYDASRVRALLDQCKQALDAEAAALQTRAASAPADFSRVWTLRRDGHVGAAGEADVDDEPEPADVWAQLLDRAGAAAASSAPQLLIEDVNGRLLRARRHKVDYAVGESKTRGAPTDDAEYVDMGDADAADDEPAPEPPRPLEPRLVSKDDLPTIVTVHNERLIATYRDQDRREPPMPADHARAIVARFNQLMQRTEPQPGAVPGAGSPDLFFALPANLRLRQNTQLPDQPYKGRCPMCGTPGAHRRTFCPFICDPWFISEMRAIKQLPGYWRHPYFHNFAAWYTVQYVWFVLSHPQGEAVHRANARRHPAYAIDAASYLGQVRAARDSKLRAQAERRQLAAQTQALADERAAHAAACAQTLYEPDTAAADVVSESSEPPAAAARAYALESPDSDVFRRFCDKLAGQRVDLPAVTDLEWLRTHLEWLAGYRSKLVVAARRSLDKRDLVFDQAKGLRFIAMRMEQVRLRIQALTAVPRRPAAPVEPAKPTVPEHLSITAADAAPLTSSDLYMYIRKLGDLKNTLKQTGGTPEHLHLICMFLEQTRNYCATILAGAEPQAPVLNRASKLVEQMVKRHDELVRQGDSRALKASQDINVAVIKVWSAVKSSVQKVQAKRGPAAAGGQANGGPAPAVSVGAAAADTAMASGSPAQSSRAPSVAMSVSPIGSARASPVLSISSGSVASNTEQPARASAPPVPANANLLPSNLQSRLPQVRPQYAQQPQYPQQLHEPQHDSALKYSRPPVPAAAMPMPQQQPYQPYQQPPRPSLSTPAQQAYYPHQPTAMPGSQISTTSMRSASYNYMPTTNAMSPYQYNAQSAYPASHSLPVAAPADYTYPTTSALVSNAQLAELMSQNRPPYDPYQPQFAPSLMTPPDSSFYRMHAMPANVASFDLACVLCDDYNHQPSVCPIRADIGALARRRVAVEANVSLGPGIRETTLNVIDHYMQMAFTKR